MRDLGLAMKSLRMRVPRHLSENSSPHRRKRPENSENHCSDFKPSRKLLLRFWKYHECRGMLCTHNRKESQQFSKLGSPCQSSVVKQSVHSVSPALFDIVWYSRLPAHWHVERPYLNSFICDIIWNNKSIPSRWLQTCTSTGAPRPSASEVIDLSCSLVHVSRSLSWKDVSMVRFHRGIWYSCFCPCHSHLRLSSDHVACSWVWQCNDNVTHEHVGSVFSLELGLANFNKSCPGHTSPGWWTKVKRK